MTLLLVSLLGAVVGAGFGWLINGGKGALIGAVVGLVLPLVIISGEVDI